MNKNRQQEPEAPEATHGDGGRISKKGTFTLLAANKQKENINLVGEAV